MGTSCSCVDQVETLSRTKSKQEFDPVKHGARSVFGSTAEQDEFLHRQREERKRVHKHSAHSKKKTGSTQMMDVNVAPLEAKKTREESSFVAHDQGGRVSVESEPSSSGATHVHEAPEPIRVIVSASPSSQQQTTTGETATTLRSSTKASNGASGDQTSGTTAVAAPLNATTQNAGFQPIQRKPKKNLFFMPE